MKVKAFEQNDLAGCVSSFMSAYNRMPWNYKWTEQHAAAYLTEYVVNNNFVGFVLFEGMEIRAALFAHHRTWWTGNQLFVDELFVANEQQGLGYGKVLMLKAEDYCKQNKLAMVTLMTNKLMPSMKFYESIGYTRVDQFVFLFKQV